MIIYNPEKNIFASTYINDNNFFSGFATKISGDARINSHVINYFSSINLTYNKLIFLEQIHSVNINIYIAHNGHKFEKIEETDGIVTKEKNVILIVRTADCAPLIYCDKSNNLIGISHNGWRGCLKRMPQKMIEKMIDLGGNKKRIQIAIGPAIGGCCYDIDDNRYYDFLEEFDGYSDKIFIFRKGKRYLSLSMLNYLLLQEYGINKDNIDFFPFCTRCDQERFFSFRRDKKGGYGEMLSFITRL